MFTGIIEFTGKIEDIRTEGTNRIFRINAPFPEPIKVDQSIAHNGVCLTVTDIYGTPSTTGTSYSVTAVDETLKKSNLGVLAKGDRINIERCMRAGDRLDGHFVQGHVDATGKVEQIDEVEGSWMYRFSFDPKFRALLVDKGSVSINGVSLTVVEAGEDWFNVTIIPYTFEHTNFGNMQPGDMVNLEFDILGKYIIRYLEAKEG